MQSINHLENQAIEAAVNLKWDEAVKINKQIITIEKDNLDAHLRLGYALLQQNKLPQSKKMFNMVLKIQPKNNIAEDHLEKIAILSKRKKKINGNQTVYDPELFIEIPGRTRTVHLVNLGQKEDIAGLNIGEQVMLKEKRRKLEVRSLSDSYIGSLPDDISKRLTYFIKENSNYFTHIKEMNLSDVVVFIRELSKGKKVKKYPSFPSNPHIMLSDINQIEESDNPSEDDKVDDEDDLTPGLEIDDDTLESYEQDKDINSIVQIEEEDEEEE